MLRRIKERLRVMVPASIMALMLGLLFAPAAGAYWNTGGYIPSYFDVAKGNYPWGIYSNVSTPDPNMSCGQTANWNAVGMGVYDEWVQTGVEKSAYNGLRRPYASSLDHSGFYRYRLDQNAPSFDPGSYHPYMISYEGELISMGSTLYGFLPAVFYSGTVTPFPTFWLVDPPHSSFTGMESNKYGCLTGYSKFQDNQYATYEGGPITQPWCYDAYGQPTFATQSLPLGSCIDGVGKEWWIGN